MPHASPDLFNGTAGRLRFYLWLFEATGEPAHLNCALAAGERLLASAVAPAHGELLWEIPPGYDGLSGHAYLGYAHGAAGIGDALHDLYRATGRERFLEAALAAARWLERNASPSLPDAEGLAWPATPGAQPSAPFWCHGAGGIARFFLHLSDVDAFPQATALAERAATSAAVGARWAGPTQCHGLAGNIELLLDMRMTTRDAGYLTAAHDLARLLATMAVERDGLLLWPSDSGSAPTPDFMVGYAGVAACFLRLSSPERLPHLL
jgi:lantibiotic modifying enzyme